MFQMIPEQIVKISQKYIALVFHKSITEGTVQKSMLGHRMRKPTTIRWYGDRRKCLPIIGWGYGKAKPSPDPTQ